MLNARFLGIVLLISAVPAYLLHAATGNKMSLFTSCMLILFGLAACVRLRSNPETLRDKWIVVIGCDAGICHQLALSLAAWGAKVIATCRSLESEGAVKLKQAGLANLHCLLVDVTSDQDVAAGVNAVTDLIRDSSLFAVVCNSAAEQVTADMELTSISDFNSLMQINFFGFVRISQGLMPLLRENKGKLITITSVNGRCSFPLAGAFSATQFAVEAAMDAWRLELARFGVSAVLIQPSRRPVATSVKVTPRSSDELHEAYGEEYLAAMNLAEADSPADSSASEEVDAVLEALATDAPRDRYFVRGGAYGGRWPGELKVIALARDWLPASLHDLLIGWRILAKLPLPQLAAYRLQQANRIPLFH